MKTVNVEQHIDIAAPAAEVWDVLADYSRDPEWRDGVVSMVPEPGGPARVGTTTAETMRLGGRTWHNAGEVTAVTPGEQLSWRTTEGADAHGTRVVEPLGPGACRASLTIAVTPHGAERLMTPMLARMLEQNLRRSLEQLRSLVEREATGAAAGRREAQQPA